VHVYVHRLKVLEVFQGDAQAGDIVEITSLNRARTGFRGHFRTLGSVGGDLVLFLELMDDGRLDFITRYQASYRVPDSLRDESMLDMPADTVLQSVFTLNGGGRFTITAGFLQRLAEGNFGA